MYTLNATFEAPVDQEQTLAAVLGVLPAGATGSLLREPALVDVPDLSDEHIGQTVRGHIGDVDEFGGVLQAIAKTTNGNVALTVNGVANIVGNFEVVQVLPEVTTGEHTPDEPEVEPEAEVDDDVDILDLSDYDSVVAYALSSEAALAPALIPAAGWLSRPVIEGLLDTALTDDQWELLANSVRAHLSSLVDSVAPSIVEKHFTILKGMEADA